MKTFMLNSVFKTNLIHWTSVGSCDVGPIVAAQTPHLYLINPSGTED